MARVKLDIPNPLGKTKFILAGMSLARASNDITSVKANFSKVDFMAGGKWFAEAIVKHGVNENGDKLRIYPILLEAAELIADFRVAQVATSGAAQVFKSLIHWNLSCALITIGGRNFAWTFPQDNTIAKIVPTGFKPIILAWEQSLDLIRKASPTDSKSLKLHQSVRGTARFISANNNTAQSKQREGTATANTNQVAFSSDLAFYEERSQYPQKEVDAIRRRFLQGRIETMPERLIGTPGHGGGIELEISQSKYDFYPATICKGCDREIFLHPLGCLLKLDGDKYLSQSGRPIAWHHSDPTAPIESAYYGCPHCQHSLDRHQRLHESYFVCQHSGIKLRDFLADLPYGAPLSKISAGLTLSPLIRDSHQSAQNIVERGVNGADPQDWQQQELGIPSTFSSNGITIAHLRSALINKAPTEQWDYQFWGLDQGRGEHWLCMVRYWVPKQQFGSRAPTDVEIYENAVRQVVYVDRVRLDGDTERDRINILGSHISHCDGGALDNEPEREWADKIRSQFPGVVLFDQVGGRTLGGAIQKSIQVQVGGRKIDALAIDTHRLQSLILDNFIRGNYILPPNADPQDLSEGAPARHLTTSTRNPDTGKWLRPNDKIDDLLKALMGCELRFYLEVFGGAPVDDAISLIEKMR